MADEWTHEGAQPITVRARSHGGFVEYRVDEARMHHSMYDAHPIHGTSSPVSSATLLLRNANDHDLTGAAPDPLSRPGNWPPADGLGMEVDVGDGRPSGWRRQLTGIVTGTSGSLSSPVVEVEVADDMKSLNKLISSASPTRSDAIHSSLPPHPDGDGMWRYVNMTTTYLADLAARAAGYYATAIPRLQSRLIVPMMGSLLPEHGTITIGGGTVAGFPYPRRIVAPWGLAMGYFDATYVPSSTVGLPFEIVVDLPPRDTDEAAGPAYVYLADDANGGRRFVLAYHHGTDIITLWWSPPDGSPSTTLVTLARDGATRVAARVDSTQASLRRDIDESATTVSHGLDLSGWAGTRVRAWSYESSLGGIEIASNPPAWSTINAPRTARLRTSQERSSASRWNACPHTIGKTSAEVLNDLAVAELGAWWMSKGSTLEYAGGGVLEAQQPVATITSDVDLADLSWSTTLGSQAATVRIEWEQPSVRASREATREVWRGGESGLESGDLWETWATPPDDEDWIGVDTTLHKVGPSSTQTQMRIGSVYALESGETEDYEYSSWDTLTQAVVERVNQRAYKWTVSPLADPGRVVNLRWPDNLAALDRNFRRSWEGEQGLILRGVALIKWASQTSPPRSTGASAASSGEYVHNAGRYVQRDDHRQHIEDYLAAELSSGKPAVTLTVRPRPDYEVGTLIEVQDKARTGLTVTLLIQKIDPTWRPGDADMTISGRVTAWEIDTTIRDEAAPLPHWLQLQSGHGSTGIGGSYGD